MNSLYVISAVGKDQPGLVHSVTDVLAKLKINIVDVEAQAVRGHFMLFLVVDLSTSKSSYEEMLVKLDLISSNFNLGLRAEPYEEGRRKSDKKIMLLTVMGGDQTGIVAMLSGIFFENGINIESVKMIARGDYIAMEIALDISDLNDMFAFRKILYEFSDKTGLDVSLRGDDIFQKPKKVVVFDCDSTLIQSEVIDELGKMAKVSERVKEMTDRAMKGELDFKQAVKERVRLLKGLPAEQLELLSKTIRLTPGAEELISMLHFMGYKVAVISGGFSFFTNYLKKRLHLDYVYTNELVIRDGEITGEIKGDIIDAEKKGEIIQEIAELENISVDQIVA
ncbi:MAG: phosphoserine phosphatase SerB, partial [Desulfobacterales bacterium]|nr:phosphoserine phosphatase SerB [Desulfobacterales bacterium]